MRRCWIGSAGSKPATPDERKEQEQAILRCQKEYKRLEDPLQAMYLDKLDGHIDNAFYHRMSAQWRVEQTRLLREIERHGEAEESYMDDGVRLLELARNARQLFARQAPGEKKRLINLVLSNCTWDDGEVRAVFRQPFDLLAKRLKRYLRSKLRELSHPQSIQFGWGSWKLFELFAMLHQPNYACSQVRPEHEKAAMTGSGHAFHCGFDSEVGPAWRP